MTSFQKGNKVLWLDPESGIEHKASIVRQYKSFASILLSSMETAKADYDDLKLAPLRLEPDEAICEAGVSITYRDDFQVGDRVRVRLLPDMIGTIIEINDKSVRCDWDGGGRAWCGKSEVDKFSLTSGYLAEGAALEMVDEAPNIQGEAPNIQGEGMDKVESVGETLEIPQSTYLCCDCVHLDSLANKCAVFNVVFEGVDYRDDCQHFQKESGNYKTVSWLNEVTLHEDIAVEPTRIVSLEGSIEFKNQIADLLPAETVIRHVQYLNFAEIRQDGGTQQRTKLDLNHIARLAEHLEDGQELDPAHVFFDGESYWLADGFHRVHAYKEKGIEDIPVLIFKGDRRVAQLNSVGANADHRLVLPRSNADKRKAVETLLGDPEWSSWSDREIGRVAKVHHSTVSAIRSSLANSPVTDDSMRVYKTKHGTETTMKVSNIGKKSQPSASEIETDEIETGEIQEKDSQTNEIQEKDSQTNSVPPTPHSEPIKIDLQEIIVGFISNLDRLSSEQVKNTFLKSLDRLEKDQVKEIFQSCVKRLAWFKCQKNSSQKVN